MANVSTEKPPRWVVGLDRFTKNLSEDFLGGPKRLKFAWSINLHKGASALVVLLLMLIYRNFSTAAWVYLALHGRYGFIWLFKHFTFPDPLPVSIAELRFRQIYLIFLGQFFQGFRKGDFGTRLENRH